MPIGVIGRKHQNMAILTGNQMDRQELINSIAYCGLVCGRCHLGETCDGCKNTARLCSRSAICYQRICCIKKALAGCWECAEFPCGNDMHAPPHDLRIRAFVTFIKNEGAETLIDCLLRNESRGIYYGFQRDYDGKSNEEEVIRLLKGDEVKRQE
jgi:hypothetical protein